MKTFTAGEFCQLTRVEPLARMPAWTNLASLHVKSPSLIGAGVYACFWDHKLIYIGLHVGPVGNPFGASVSDRLAKHILGFTLRTDKLSFSKSGLTAIITELKDRDGDSSPIASDLKALERDLLIKDRGLSSTFNKARFAARHWESLRDASASEIMERFSACFLSVEPGSLAGLTKAQIKALICKQFEKPAIEKFQPSCNTAMRRAEGGDFEFDDVAEFLTVQLSEFQNMGDDDRDAMTVQASKDAGELASAHDLDDADETSEADGILPPDDQFFEYQTQDGQWRVKSTDRPRVLALARSQSTVACLASVARLAEAGIDAQETAPSETVMNSVVELGNWDGTAEFVSKLKTVVEASLQELEHLR